MNLHRRFTEEVILFRDLHVITMWLTTNFDLIIYYVNRNIKLSNMLKENKFCHQIYNYLEKR